MPRLLLLLALALAAAPAPAATAPGASCLRASGGAAARCLDRWSDAVARCRLHRDADCEAGLRAAGGPLDLALDALEATDRDACPGQTAEPLGYLHEDDVVLRGREGCEDWAEDFLDLAVTQDPSSLSGAFLACQREVTRRLGSLRDAVVRLTGADCNLPGYRGDGCNRARRDHRLAELRDRAARKIAKRCGRDALAALGLGPIDALLDAVVTHARHYAQLTVPPNDLGPTADFGPYEIGITTMALTDPSRSNVQGTGPRPVTVEVYYPSTAAATAGKPRDVAMVLGIPVIETPAFRDVARAPGEFPLVVFSHGNGGVRIQSFFFAAHLASHGYVVVSPDHHGNTFVDALQGIVDPNVATNRPLDMSFIIDRFLAFDAQPGHAFAGAIDENRIGASGHSFGGFTAFLLAGTDGSAGGAFVDERVKAILPQAPAAPFSDAFFASITVPVMILGGTIDGTTPFESQQQHPFDALQSGAQVVALGELRDGGHFTFSDFCEVPRDLLAFLGGFGEACEPRHLPWRHAHDIVNYLSLNFFDAVLLGDAAALARLEPAAVAGIEDLRWERK